MDFVNLKKEDKEIYDLMKKELKRQEKGIELIASENFVSRAVMEAMGSHLTNKSPFMVDRLQLSIQIYNINY